MSWGSDEFLGKNGADMSMGVWLLLVCAIAGLLYAGWRLEHNEQKKCYGLAMILATVIGYQMKSSLGVFTWMMTTNVWLALLYMGSTGYTPVIAYAVMQRNWRVWRKLEWSGEFVHPPHDRVR